MGCTTSQPALEGKHEPVPVDDHTGVSVATASDAPNAPHYLKSTMTTTKLEDTTALRSNRTKTEHKVTFDEEPPEEDLNASQQSLNYADQLEVTVQPNNASMHLNNSYDSTHSDIDASAKTSGTNPETRSRRSSVRRRPAFGSNPRLDRARERMSVERKNRKKGPPSPGSRRSKARKATGQQTSTDDTAIMALPMDLVDGAEDLDVSQLGASGFSVDLGDSSKSHQSAKSNGDRDAEGHKTRIRKSGGSRGKRASLQNRLNQIDSKDLPRKDQHISRPSRESNHSRRSGASRISTSSKKKSLSPLKSPATRTASPTRRQKPSHPKTSRSNRRSIPANEPRRKSTVPIGAHDSPTANPSPGTAPAPEAENVGKVATPPVASSPTESPDVIANPRNCLFSLPPSIPKLPVFAPSQHSPGGTTYSQHSSIGAPSQHSQESLNSYLPHNMKAHPKSPKSIQNLTDSSLSSLPSLTSFSSLSEEDQVPVESYFSPMPEQDIREEGGGNGHLKARKSRVSDFIHKINPLKFPALANFEGLSDSSGDEAEAMIPKGSSSTASRLADVAKNLDISNQNHTFNEDDDKTSVTGSTASDAESEHSLDIFADVVQDPVVFKYDASDPTIAQFNPLKAEAEHQLHKSTSAIERIHLRQSLRAKRNSPRRYDELKAATLHSSFTQVDALKAMEAMKSEATPRRGTHIGHGKKHRRGTKSTSNSMPTNKPRALGSKEAKDLSLKDLSEVTRTRARRQPLETHQKSKFPSTPTRQPHPSTHASSPRRQACGGRPTVRSGLKAKRSTIPTVPAL